MRKKLIYNLASSFLFLCFSQNIQAQYWKGETTPTYSEMRTQCLQLAKKHQEIELYNMGSSDANLPIYLMVINGAGDSTATFNKARNGTAILVNNAIHPGEPDGVNAMFNWVEDWIAAGKPTDSMPVIGFITAYNVGGMNNRSSTSRANQNGPEEYGFRGNARNFDLNRDFVKMDTKNSFTFVKIYQALDPDVFIDNHVTNGADYQYYLTVIPSLKERLMPSVRSMTYDKLWPFLKVDLLNKGVEMAPYVNLKDETPDNGLVAFNDLPRYAMGYASLFHSLSFTVETHMLKPFPARVQVTQDFFESTLDFVKQYAQEIEEMRKRAVKECAEQPYFLSNFKLNEGEYEQLEFLGFSAKYKPSEVTGLSRLYYDRTAPWTKKIPYYNSYQAGDSARMPQTIYIAATEEKILERLRANGVEMSTLSDQVELELTVQRVIHYNASSRPYEGHFSYRNQTIQYEQKKVKLPKGSVRIQLNQPKGYFLLHVLMGASDDGYFTWNFMDSYLDEKEYFSPYVFEDVAAQLLKDHPDWKEELLEKRKMDRKFAESQWAQLFFIYQKSEYFEPNVGVLPIYLAY
ncbi:MAG: hypothetical protein N4A41_13685 [Crocinitomicaceae bacterium]|jgi:hypothetical protein|nr:hypothetical protein [Crocinitomicaceae bacterium]